MKLFHIIGAAPPWRGRLAPCATAALRLAGGAGHAGPRAVAVAFSTEAAPRAVRGWRPPVGCPTRCRDHAVEHRARRLTVGDMDMSMLAFEVRQSPVARQAFGGARPRDRSG
jgi:hypothetical protein